MSQNNAPLNELMDVILKMKTRAELENLLLGILTEKELIEIPQRLEIVKMLKKGIAQHEIADKMHVGVATVTRGSKEIKMGRFKYV